MDFGGKAGLIGLETVGEARCPIHRDAFTLAARHGVAKGMRRIGLRHHACMRRKYELREKKQPTRQLGEPPVHLSCGKRSHIYFDSSEPRRFLVPLGVPVRSYP